MRWILWAAILGPGLAACAGDKANVGVEGRLDMALSCQLKSCICVSVTSAAFFARKTSPVRWHRDGNAYCDEGFELEFGEDEKRRR